MAKIHGATGSISWIDKRAKFLVDDPTPADTITEGFIMRVTNTESFRFSNYLRGWIETKDGKTITDHQRHPNSGLYRAPSFWGTESFPYGPTTADKVVTGDNDVQYAEWTQSVGGRATAPEKIGKTAGTVVGVGGGGLLGATGGPIGVIGGMVIGGLIGRFLGGVIGRNVINYPPIWTTVVLKIWADEKIECVLRGHSHFPSVSFYCDPGATGRLQKKSQYDAQETDVTEWKDRGWDTGNPWHAQKP